MQKGERRRRNSFRPETVRAGKKVQNKKRQGIEKHRAGA